MPGLPLNFPVFYHCAVKGKTNLTQYNAVSILLLGRTRSETESDIVKMDGSVSNSSKRSVLEISDADAANYVSGKKGIKKEVFAEVVDITAEEAEKRLEKLGIQDISSITEALKRLIINLDIKPDICKQLLASHKEGKLTLAANMFLMAVRYPAKKLVPLSKNDKKLISLCFASEKKFSADSHQIAQEEADNSSCLTYREDEADKHHLVSQEELELLLQGAGYTPPAPYKKPAKTVISRIEPYIDHIITYPMYIGALKASAFSELTNIVLSRGVSSLGNLFDETTHADVPEFAYYADFETLNNHLFNDSRVRLVFKFFLNEPSDPELERSKIMHGYIVLSADQSVFEDYYNQNKQIHPTKFITYNESVEYKSSMYREIGSIFSETSVTALSNIFSERCFKIEEASIFHMENSLQEMGPIFAGILPFSLMNSSSCAFLLMNYRSAQTLLSSQKEYL